MTASRRSVSAQAEEPSTGNPEIQPVDLHRGQRPLLQVQNLSVEFVEGNRRFVAVSGLSYELGAGNTLAIVGESGAGKSVSCRALTGLLPATARLTGSVCLDGKELLGLDETQMRRHRGCGIAMAFQDTGGYLNPTMCVGYQIAEAVRVHESIGGRAAKRRAVDLLRLLGVPEPGERFFAYPHQLSGGTRQRVMISIALAANPRVLIADEITRSLDVATRKQLMSTLRNVQETLGMTIVMVTHDLSLAAAFADRLLVMYAGRPVELAPSDDLFKNPRMPYTRSLLDAIPRLDGPAHALSTADRPKAIEVSSPKGCSYQPLCVRAQGMCADSAPPFLGSDHGHHCACWFPLGLETSGT